ncbi:MAG: hypothetical protein AAF492_05115 [Verrucomicrobiota bacterium]
MISPDRHALPPIRITVIDQIRDKAADREGLRALPIGFSEQGDQKIGSRLVRAGAESDIDDGDVGIGPELQDFGLRRMAKGLELAARLGGGNNIDVAPVGRIAHIQPVEPGVGVSGNRSGTVLAVDLKNAFAQSPAGRGRG